MRTTLKPYLWTLGLLWALPAALVAIGYAVLDHTVDCNTSEFGCMSEADGLLFAAFLVWWTILGPLGVLAAIVIAVVQTTKRTRRARAESSTIQQG